MSTIAVVGMMIAAGVAPMSDEDAALAGPAEAALDRLFGAVCQVESEGDPNAYNKAEQAAGIAQIRPICLEDCNRIAEQLKLKHGDPPQQVRWTLGDRYDPVKSREMFGLYLGWYAQHWAQREGQAGVPVSVVARMWRGPYAINTPESLDYWAKIKMALETGRAAAEAAKAKP